ncbi:putative sugar O-methyltransferase [Pseudogemmobacter sonorensis]|uniref:putative sugar O-methyltransferase n=1 Tax=Pseudogemmobacter sonorensis TaxID=2989681 RepID=UPI00367E18B8
MLNPPPHIKARPKLLISESPREMITLSQCELALTSIKEDRVFGTLGDDTEWKWHTDGGQRPLTSAILERDAERIHSILNNIHGNSTMEGFDQHKRHTDIISSSVSQQEYHAKVIYATLLRCGMALGVIRAYNPEQNENYPYLSEDQTDTVLSAVLAALKLSAPLPRTVSGAIGLDTASGLLSHRQAISLGYLREYRDLLATYEKKYDAIVEIGGGIGRIAYNIARGKDVCYTIVDLPAVGFVQYAFLTSNGVKCSLWPDELKTDPGHVNIISAFSTRALRSLNGALFLNFDGFVEMSKESLFRYFRLISKTKSDLLSVNQEAASKMLGHVEQNWNIARLTEFGLHASRRSCFWERSGYVTHVILF